MPDSAELYKTAQAAAYCGMTYDQFRWYVRTGEIVPHSKPGRRPIRFTRAALDAFKAQERHGPGRRPKQVECPSCGCSFPLKREAVSHQPSAISRQPSAGLIADR